ncbi:MAG: autotransporter-associated beta strand repeat-containing protein [Luteolibacter sp.]|uniref:beta strand repeat-containing protein n=1 Tax=Luteolibacter sp. TaxID=1962973 RepID=UPI00326469EA
MKRPKFKKVLRPTLQAVPLAALMLGAAEAGTTVGLNFQSWYYDSGVTPQTVGYGAGYQTTGFPVTAKAFGIDTADWTNADPFDCSNPISETVPFGGTLSAAVTAPNAWQSGIGAKIPGFVSGITVDPGNNEVTWGYLDDGNTDGGHPSVDLTGLAAKFPSGYVIATITGGGGTNVFNDVDITDGVTTSTVAYATEFVENPPSNTDGGGGTVGISAASAVFTSDTISVIPQPKTAGKRSTLAAIVVTDKPVILREPSGGGTFATGSTVSLTANVIGLPPLIYQWKRNGADIPGGTSLSYTDASLAPDEAGDYTLVVTNGSGTATSVAVHINVVTPSYRIWAGNVNGTWDIGTTANWTDGSNPTTYNDLDNVVFDDSATTTAITLAAPVNPSAIFFTNNTKSYDLSGSPIAGLGSLIKMGTGNLTLSGANTFTGAVDIQSGKVITNNSGSLGSGTSAVSLGANAILEASVSHTLNRGLILAGGAAQISTAAGATLTMTTSFAGGGGVLTKTGTGTLRIQGYVGGNFGLTSMQINAGTIEMAGHAFNSDLGLASITVNPGAVLAIPAGSAHALGGAYTNSPVINLLGGTFAIGQEQYLDAINMTGATIQPNGGPPEIRSDYNFNLHTLASPNSSFINGITFNRVNSNFVFTVDDGPAAEDLIFEGTIMTGTDPVTKAGPGVMVMQGALGYTAPTLVDAGTLVANAVFDTSSVTVAATATLGGTGSIFGSVVVKSGGTLAPGVGVGEFFTGPLTLETGSTLAAQLDSSGAPTADAVNVDGDVTLAGTLSPTDIATTPVALAIGTKLTLITYTGALTGTFTDLSEGSSINAGVNNFTISYNDSSAVTLTAVAGSPFTTWVTGAPYNLSGSNALPGADPDHDGIANSIEFVLGGNPATVSDTALLPTSELVTNPGGSVPNGNYLKFTFRRTSASASLTPAAQSDTDLAGPWTTAVAGQGGVVVVTTANFYGTGVDRVICYIPRPATGPFFGRLSVTTP